MSITVNDVHSRLNETRVAAISTPGDLGELAGAVRAAAASAQPIAVSGGRHAMGGQQFLEDGLLVDCRRLDRILDFDLERGTLTVEAGCTWLRLVAQYEALQRERLGKVVWGFAQKQTGADSLTLGGAVSANAHGRGLLMKPLVDDVLAVQIVTAQGELQHCSREQNPERFRMVVGGYGLFGVVYAVTLRLAPRRVLRRVVRVIDIEEAVPAARRRIAQGFCYGDFQFDIDENSPDFLTKGVFCGYVPLEEPGEPPRDQKELQPHEWEELLYLAHVDKRRAFHLYASHYLATDGQLYHSDTHQLSAYSDDYHQQLDRRLGAHTPGSEMITELYVPHARLVDFLRAASRRLVELRTPVIYGTIRLISKDSESFLPWARQDWACIVLNLHVDHSACGVERAARAFRALIDEALERDGSFFLTYHRFATRGQLLRAYPELPAFIEHKLRFDPAETFQSNWYRWLRRELAL